MDLNRPIDKGCQSLNTKPRNQAHRKFHVQSTICSPEFEPGRGGWTSSSAMLAYILFTWACLDWMLIISLYQKMELYISLVLFSERIIIELDWMNWHLSARMSQDLIKLINVGSRHIKQGYPFIKLLNCPYSPI